MLTSIRIHSKLFASFQRIYQTSSLDALDAEVGENHLHVDEVYFILANSIIAAFSTDNIVWMRPEG